MAIPECLCSQLYQVKEGAAELFGILNAAEAFGKLRLLKGQRGGMLKEI